MRDDQVSLISFLIFLAVLWFFLLIFGNVHAGCVDCLVKQANSEIVITAPTGHQWGTREGAPTYRVERFCVPDGADPSLLAAPLQTDQGVMLADHRFEAVGNGNVYDRKTAIEVTPAQAVAAAAADQAVINANLGN